MKLLAILLTLSLISTAHAETTAEIVGRLGLPDEPNELLDQSTVLGVDKNNNKINDRLERIIGLSFPNDEYARKVYNRQAKLWTLMVENSSNKDKVYKLYSEYIMNINCSVKGYIAVPDNLEITHFEASIRNTPDRDRAMIKILDTMGYSLRSKAYKFSLDDVKKYCEGFINYKVDGA